jgi:hypothetical protein
MELMKERTFLEYYNDYGFGFIDYGKMFHQWTKFRGYIPTTFANDIYIFCNKTLYCSHNDFDDKTNDIGEKLSQEFNQEIELDFAQSFISILFPKSPTRGGKITLSTPDKVIEKFKERLSNVIITDKNLLENFLNDFSMFLTNFDANIAYKYGYYFVENIKNYYWQDFGVIICRRTYMSEDIIFYQIADDN